MKNDECGMILKMDRYEYGVVIERLVKLHNSRVHENQPHGFVDEVLLKTLAATGQKTRASEIER